MNAEHRHELEQNELASSVQNLWDRTKSGKLVSPRVLGIIVAAVLVLGLWWYLANSGKSAASAQWKDLDLIATKSSLEDFAKAKGNVNTVAGRVALLQLARVAFVSEGIAKLNSRNTETREKAIASIEESKAEFVKLAAEFKTDPTLRAQCLDLAAKAELSLVGVPKAKDSTEFKGSVEMAVAHIRTIAETVGKETAAGKAALEQALDLEKNRENVIALGRELESELTPAAFSEPIKLPEGSLGNPAIPPTTSPNLTLPSGISPVTVPPATPAPTAPSTVPPTPATPAPTTPPAAAVAGGAATATTPATKK